MYIMGSNRGHRNKTDLKESCQDPSVMFINMHLTKSKSVDCEIYIK